MNTNNQKYRLVFFILDAIFAVLDFIRMVPWYVWYGIEWTYMLTIYRTIIFVQIKLNERRLKSL